MTTYYHPSRGAWEVPDGPAPQSILDKYPSGTIEAPARPSQTHEFTGVGWVVVAADTNTDLTSREFEYLLDVSGLDDAWSALAAHLKNTDRAAYANLQDERRKKTYRLGYTLTQVAAFRPVLAAIGYDVSSLTDANITSRWNAIVGAR